MKDEDFELHEMLIRGLKGLIKAYETWLGKKRQIK